MRVIDAFAGIGGFSIAADSLGWETVAFVEREPFPKAVLAHHWPGVPIYDDITTVRWEDAPVCDIFTAGFPCQPHSLAGKRGSHDDERDLWAECVRAVRDLRPRYACFENVPGLLTSDFAENVGGRRTTRPFGFFGRVLRDLAEIGYDAEWAVLSAAECGAPHRRERVWIVAYPQLAESDVRGRPDGELGLNANRGGESTFGDVAESGGGLGDPELSTGSRLGQLGGHGDAAARGHGQKGSMVRRHALPDWSDAIPYRGANGTVRLIPRGAVELGDPSSGRCGGESRRGAGQEPADGHGELSGREAEGPWTQPSLRFMAHGLLARLLRRCGNPQEGEEKVDGTESDMPALQRAEGLGGAQVSFLSKGDSTETMRVLREDDGTQGDERSPRGSCDVREAQALLAHLRQLASGSDAARSESEGVQAAPSELRGLRCDRESARGDANQTGCPSCGRESLEQLARELADALSQLPHEVASRAWPAWGEGCRSDADRLAGRDRGGEEAEPWSTPVGQPAGSTAAAFIQRKRNAIAKGSTMGLSLSDCHLQSVEFGGTGGSLWPVTESEPGRVAKLKAVGNAVVPAWVLAGPFRRILELEATRPTPEERPDGTP